jgi:ribonuclease HII
MSSLSDFDLAYLAEYDYIIGIDEVGRGCLAGPLVVCGVIMRYDDIIEMVNDSKTLSAQKRTDIYPELLEHALRYELIEVDIEMISELNIYQATKQAMQTLAEELYQPNSLILVDAMPLDVDYPCCSLIKGDTLSYAIACASIIAKVYRDNIMIALDREYPEYDFINNKGYGTKKHRDALARYGYLAGIHRLSFEPIKSMIHKQLSLLEEE